MKRQYEFKDRQVPPFGIMLSDVYGAIAMMMVMAMMVAAYGYGLQMAGWM